jgi:dephospho-CoA kinase
MTCRIVGLTGSIGTGKSTVGAILRELGAAVIDADKVAHQIYARDQKLRAALVKRFGRSVISDNGTIDRKKLSLAAFKTKADITALEKITHPAIIREIRKRISQSGGESSLCVIEAPLLFEAGFDRFCDAVVLVTAPLTKVTSRAKLSRHLSIEELEKRNNRQLPVSTKLERSDHLIDNGGSLAQTRRQTRLLYERLTNNSELI